MHRVGDIFPGMDSLSVLQGAQVQHVAGAGGSSRCCRPRPATFHVRRVGLGPLLAQCSFVAELGEPLLALLRSAFDDFLELRDGVLVVLELGQGQRLIEGAASIQRGGALRVLPGRESLLHGCRISGTGALSDLCGTVPEKGQLLVAAGTVGIGEVLSSVVLADLLDQALGVLRSLGDNDAPSRISGPPARAREGWTEWRGHVKSVGQQPKNEGGWTTGRALRATAAGLTARAQRGPFP